MQELQQGNLQWSRWSISLVW